MTSFPLPLSFPAYSAVTGMPLTGLSSSLTWLEYLNVETGSPVTPPTFAEFGATGLYFSNVTANATGIVDLTAACFPRYVFYGPIYCVPAFSLSTGAPLSGLTPTWGSIYDTASETAVVPQPSFSEFSGTGIYKITGLTSTMTCTINWGATALPQYLDIDTVPLSLGPSIGTPTPTPGSTITTNQVILVPIADPSYTIGDLTIIIVASYSNGSTELIYSPLLGWSSVYPGSSLPASLPGDIILTRTGGWPSAPTISVYLSDPAGLEAAADWTWVLGPQPITLISESVTPAQAPAPYGSDLRTYLDLGNGPDLDPYMLIVSDEHVVLPEQLARRLMMPPGTLAYAPTAGFDLRTLANTYLVNGDAAPIQTAIANQCLADERVQSVNVSVAPVKGSLNVSIQGMGSAGPFGIVFNVGSESINSLSVTG